MRTKPKVLVLKADGINRDEELAYAFEIAGGDARIVHVNDLRWKKDSLKNYNILAIPGGFAYGDDIASGKILAIELTSFFKDELKKFIERKDTLVIGICNGFQVLVRTGLLPFGKVGTMQTTLTNNDSGHFECRWVRLKIESNSRCVFLNPSFLRHPDPELAEGEGSHPLFKSSGDSSSRHRRTQNDIVWYPVAHGEGKFFANNETIKTIEQSNLVVFRYVDKDGKPTQKYPLNPNGALNAIGGICDTTGRVMGLMPHPECFVRVEQHPNWRREILRRAQDFQPHGLPLFQNMISYVKNA